MDPEQMPGAPSAEETATAMALIEAHPMLKDDPIAKEVAATGMFNGAKVDVGNWLQTRLEGLDTMAGTAVASLTPEDLKPSEASDTWHTDNK